MLERVMWVQGNLLFNNEKENLIEEISVRFGSVKSF